MGLTGSFIKEGARLFYWYPFRYIVQRVPLSIGYVMAGFAAQIYCIITRGDKKRMSRGLSLMYQRVRPPAPLNRIIKKTVSHNLKNGIEVLWYPKFDKTLSKKRFKVEGLSNLDNALSHGSGVVLLHGHFGNPHVIMPALGNLGYTFNQLASRNPPDKSGRYIEAIPEIIRQKTFELKLSYKEALPVRFVYVDQSMRAAIEVLRKNEILAIGIDGREGAKWVSLPFLGQSALFSTGGMNLILKTRPVVLPTFVIRQRDNTHRIVIEEQMDLKITGDKNEDVMYNMQTFIRRLETYVYRYPCQYAKAFALKTPFFEGPVPAECEITSSNQKSITHLALKREAP